MLKWLKELDIATDTWLQSKAKKKGLIGYGGPWTMYRCRKCRKAIFEGDIIGPHKKGVCPICKNNNWEAAYLSFGENFKAVLRILFGKGL